MRSSGQEAIEFVLISVLVFFAALFSMLVLGDKVAAFFNSDGSAVKASQGSSIAINPLSPVRFHPDYTTTAPSGTFSYFDPSQIPQPGTDTPTPGT